MKYVVIYEDRFGRTQHGVTSDPAHLTEQLLELAREMGEKEKDARKRLKRATVLEVLT